MVSKWRWYIFVGCLIAVLLPIFSLTCKRLDDRFKGIEKTERWQASNFWLKSVECMRKTGVWLAFFKSDSFYEPQKEVDEKELIDFSLGSAADDPGHTLLLSIGAKILHRDMEIVDVVKVNALINLLGLVCLLALIFAMRAYFVFGALLILSKFIFFTWLKEHPHPAGIGVAALATILPLSLLAHHYQCLEKKKVFFFFALGLLTLALATLIRGVIGEMGFAVTFVACFWIFLKQKNNLKNGAFVFLTLFLALMAWQSPKWTFMIRDAFTSEKIQKRINENSSAEGFHGISHVLYIGLGVVPNQFGIVYADEYGCETIKNLRPDITYLTPEYFKEIRKLYLQKLKEAPKEVARIYFKKLCIMLSYPVVIGTLLLNVLLFAALQFYRNHSLSRPLATISFMFVLLFILQGVFAHTDMAYACPIAVFSALIFGTIAEYGWKEFQIRQEKFKLIRQGAANE